MTEMTMTQAVEMLRGLIPDEDALQINDGAQMWDASALVDATREHDNGELHDLAVNDEGISRVRPDGTISSTRIYWVQPRPTVAGLAAELRAHGVPEKTARVARPRPGSRPGAAFLPTEGVDQNETQNNNLERRAGDRGPARLR